MKAISSLERLKFKENGKGNTWTNLSKDEEHLGG